MVVPLLPVVIVASLAVGVQGDADYASNTLETLRESNTVDIRSGSNGNGWIDALQCTEGAWSEDPETSEGMENELEGVSTGLIPTYHTASWLPEIFDAEVHLHNVHEVPRRGSVVAALLQWIPSATIRAHLVALFAYPRSLLVALNVDEDPTMIIDPLDGQHYYRLAKGLNVSGALWTESTSTLGPQGLSNLASVAIIEARWLAGQRLGDMIAKVPSLATVSGLLGQDLFTRKNALLQHAQTLNGIQGVRAIRWVVDDPSGRINAAALTEAAVIASKLGLTLEVAVPASELRELSDIAASVPSVKLVVTHAGGPQHCGRPLANCTRYMRGLETLAQQHNVYLKFSRLAAFSTGLGYSASRPASSSSLVRDWQEVFRKSLDWFGPHRLLFGSGFPLDGAAMPLSAFWSAARILVQNEVMGLDEQRAILAMNAQALYLPRT
ncbi:Hypothetical Protein FCC1311_054162 [Hondaea fermentalgiana]|uniref:Amidohydrolase-related domain-containing protein n=1 Tax=Hondaea fermentalgiana TaxID=2315210 RepID=A0A2R5GMV3_9STRA|nr:Hypothetical Protein FCC1311_054162 [Hondaea fermentalgiana]|eukprot:GBG29194.1 Hypothetical Protein FCC1311_054162 [Hondaea fermentalgiana]